jgi:hypothetical protein
MCKKNRKCDYLGMTQKWITPGLSMVRSCEECQMPHCIHYLEPVGSLLGAMLEVPAPAGAS